MLLNILPKMIIIILQLRSFINIEIFPQLLIYILVKFVITYVFVCLSLHLVFRLLQELTKIQNLKII